MPTTTRLALPYPNLADNADVPEDIAALANAIDAIGIPYTTGTYAARPAAPVASTIYRQTDAGGGYLAGTYWIYAGAWRLLVDPMSLAAHSAGGTYVVPDAYQHILLITTTAANVTLPTIVNTGSYRPITIYNTAPGDCVVTTSGSDIINKPAKTSITIPQNGSVTLVPVTATTKWVTREWGGEAAATLNGAESFTGVKTFAAAPQHAVQSMTASGNISATGGKIVRFSGSSGQTLTLPAAVVGMEFEVWNMDTGDTVTVARAGADTINGGASVIVGTSAVRRFVCVAAGAWLSMTDGAIA